MGGCGGAAGVNMKGRCSSLVRSSLDGGDFFFFFFFFGYLNDGQPGRK